MLRFLTAAFVSCFAFLAAAQTPLSDLPLGDAAQFSERPHIIVTARLPAGQTDTDWAEALAEENNMSVVAIWPLRSIDVICFVFSLSGDAGPVVRAISERSDVELAYPIQPFETSSSIRYRDRYVQLQNGPRDMMVWSAHSITKGEGGVVALVDTAVDISHSDLSGQNITLRNFVSREKPDALAELHGTAMAAIILADAKNGKGIVGVAPEATLLALRACWEDARDGKGRCNTFSLARALNFAILNNASVINLSLTGPSDPILEQLMASALRRDIAVVIAAPARPSGALGVNLPGVVVASSLPAKGSITAPGTEVLSAKPVNDYDFFSGASVSAAHVSGALALMRAAKPSAAIGELSAALTVSETDAKGVLNICRAFQALSDGLADCR